MFFNKKAQNYALIMAAVVAMVAVVGLVMYSQGSVSGNQVLTIQNGKIMEDSFPRQYVSPASRKFPEPHLQGEAIAQGLVNGCMSPNTGRQKYEETLRVGDCCRSKCWDGCKAEKYEGILPRHIGSEMHGQCYDACNSECQQEVNKLQGLYQFQER